VTAARRVRRAVPTDARALMRLRLELLEDQAGEAEQPDLGRLAAGEEWFAERLVSDRHFIAYVVDLDDRVVASAAGMLLPRMPQPDGVLWRGHLTSVATLPQHRGQGYATECVTAVCEALTSMGAAYVELNATASVQGLYRRLGFEPRDHDPQMRWTPDNASGGAATDGGALMPEWIPPEQYSAALPKSTVFACAMFTDEDDRLLQLLSVHHRRTEPWQWPGGNLDLERETPWEVAVRETREETGLNLPGPPRFIGTRFILPRPPHWPYSHLGFVFDGGQLTRDQLEGIRLDPHEHTAWEVRSLADWRCDMSPPEFERVTAFMAARQSGVACYYETRPQPVEAP